MSDTKTERPSVLADGSKSFGNILAQARKKKVLSLDDVSLALNILKRHIEAIEREDYQALPPKAYAQGFVRNYARFLELDDNAIARQFDAAYPKSDANIVLTQQTSSIIRRSKTPIRFNFSLAVGIVVVLIIGIALLKMVSGAKNTEIETVSATVVDGLSKAEQAQGAAIGTADALDGQAAGEVITNGIIDVWVKEPTVIVVKDSKGAVLMTGNQSRGGYQITGQSPFSVEISNPDRVDLSFNHKKVELDKYSKGNKATLMLQ